MATIPVHKSLYISYIQTHALLSNFLPLLGVRLRIGSLALDASHGSPDTGRACLVLRRHGGHADGWRRPSSESRWS
ncbi:hypothetical protein THICB2_220065 [Thiomonas sp. CB2]|nr:hypothetical protein THICB2_220065 [Thiomonas sp. CB2]CQR44787.1 hypothetical protein THICB3560152 [Thiomonas sp. CB3]VDY10059.1 protein of unknown function [Thiomonas sp. Sup16B3]VDY14003.1 conserved protein of unknown function [Thiomonas sp. OC7]VDY10956.1 protein of unknown function [Thiomonas sp. Sup16B3]